MTILYRFQFPDGSSLEFPVETSRLEVAGTAGPSAWTELGNCQCTNCPLREDETPHCPAAVDLLPVALPFRSRASHERVVVEVVTRERTYRKNCDVQTGLRSIFGLVMATSACPILSQLRGLGLVHLPFATIDESVLRVLGAYLARQYLQAKDGLEADWNLDGLRGLFKQIAEVDRCFKERLMEISESDANPNAIAGLGFLAMQVEEALQSDLSSISPYTLELSPAPVPAGS